MIIEQSKYLKVYTFPSLSDLKPHPFRLYMQANDKVSLLTHKRLTFTSYTINLAQSAEQLFDNYTAKLRQKIRFISRRSLCIERDQNPGEVIRLFTPSVQALGLNPIHSTNFKDKKHLLITRVVDSEYGTLAAHAYLLDQASGKVKSQYNASAFRLFTTNKAAQNVCAKANAFLYHQDFVYFIDAGFKTFDFGGFGSGVADSVDFFKKQFKGSIEQQYNYVPYWYYYAKRFVK